MYRKVTIRGMLAAGVAVAFIANTPPAIGYEINPLKNKYQGNQPQGGLWERITETVHEDITDAAERCATSQAARPKGEILAPCLPTNSLPPRTSVGNKYNALIRGVWWNDDPNQHLFGVHYATWVIWMSDAEGIAKKGRNWLGKSATITPGYKMQYRSHYGDLQFLHAMANENGETADAVRQRILDWTEFAYAVATEQIEPDVKLADSQMPVVTRYFSRQPGWSVHYLFAPQFTLGRTTIKDVALGSILHVVQDSFSKAHSSRDYALTAECPSGRVTEFHAYNSQDSALHGKADTRNSWLENDQFTADSNPVQVSAQLIAFARTGADWPSVVKPYLETKVFCVGKDARLSSGGGFSAS